MTDDMKERVLAFIRGYIREHGFSPSNPEIRDAVGVNSKSTVHRYLTQMADEGLIEWAGDGRNRAIALKGPECPMCGGHRAG